MAGGPQPSCLLGNLYPSGLSHPTKDHGGPFWPAVIPHCRRRALAPVLDGLLAERRVHQDHAYCLTECTIFFGNEDFIVDARVRPVSARIHTSDDVSVCPKPVRFVATTVCGRLKYRWGRYTGKGTIDPAKLIGICDTREYAYLIRFTACLGIGRPSEQTHGKRKTADSAKSDLFHGFPSGLAPGRCRRQRRAANAAIFIKRMDIIDFCQL
jgi:hypothetical protein